MGKIHWRRDRLPTPVFVGFPCDSADKESARNVGDLGSIPGLGRSSGEGKGSPLQYSWAKTIGLPECFVQMYAIHSFVGMESGIFVCMAIDRYVAICQPLCYSSIITKSFVVKATVLMALRNSLTTIPIPVLAAQRHYCSKNQIEHCLCSNLGVTSLSCDDRTINSVYQLLLAWIFMGSDLGFIFVSYALILHSVLKLNSTEATSKALSTCTSHLILILFFYTVVIVISITHSATMTFPLIPVLLNVLHNVIPPALNPDRKSVV